MSETDPLPPDDARPAADVLRERIGALLVHRETLAPALAAFAAELPVGRYRRDLRALVARLEEGAAAEELCQSTRDLGVLMPLLSAGPDPAEAGAGLYDMFLESARVDELRRQRYRVLAYPAAIGLIALPVVIFLCVVVVPVFTDIFQSFQFDLPWLTVAVVTLSNVILHQPLATAATLVGLLVLSYVGFRLLTVVGNLGIFDRFFGVFARGSSRELTAMASFTRRLAEGLAAELPLAAALELAGRINDRRGIRAAAQQLAGEVRRDASRISDSPAARRFPATLLFALSHRTDGGDAAGQTVRLLDEFADTCMERVSERINWNTGVTGQFAIVLVGVLVGVIVLAMLLPLVRLIDGLT